MKQIMIRFKIIKNDECIEVKFDDRLSFKDNLKLLENIYKRNLTDLNVYDQNKGIFLDMNIPINNFEINSFMTFTLL